MSEPMSTHRSELHGDMPALIVGNFLSVGVLEKFGFEVHLNSKAHDLVCGL